MKNQSSTSRAPFVTVILWLVIAGSVPAAPTVDSVAVKKLFANPPREYASAPLWVWNDLLTEDQIRGTMRDLAGQGVKQVFVHPRPGLMTPYLSDDWFKLWKIALSEAERLDMNVWIYDENSYPSGFAGGWVPELMPESRGMGLVFRETKTAPKWDASTVRVFRLSDQSNQSDRSDVSAAVRRGDALPEARYLTASIQRAGNSPWHAGRCYVNLLTPGVTEKFLEVTLGAYEREMGQHFGKRVPGVFTDEPEIRPAGGLPWCDDLPQQFEKRWGYSLLENLPSLTQPIGDYRKVRHNFFSTLNDLFIERWAKPYYEYCAKRNLEFTGHYWEHEWPNALGVPDSMAMAAWQQRPGIDILMNQYAEHTHAQFGNVRSCREISSLANQLGRKRTLVELYGAGGWDLRFEDMKRIGDWLQVLGVNTFDEHLSYVTLRGARKNDHPQSFSYHEPWWPAYHVMANYFTRLSAALTQGEQMNRILVLEPTTTAWMYQGDGAKLGALGDAFSKLLMALEAAQIEYDLGCEDVIARHGTVKNHQLWVGERGYDVVVLPPGMENIKSDVAELVGRFHEANGKIVCLGNAPARVDGREFSHAAQDTDDPGWVAAKPEDAVSVLHRLTSDGGFRIRRAADDRGILFHHRRQLADGQLVFLVNTSIEFPSAGNLDSDLRGVERWNLHTGKSEPYPFGKTNGGVTTRFDLPPSGSLLLFLSNKPLKPVPAANENVTTLAATGPMQVQRTAPNVLRLDYVDITAGGESRSNVYYYAAAQFAFQKNGMPANPWDSAVQFKDELISKTFPADSGFTATYRFTIEDGVPENLALVIERPDLYTITCNGTPVSPSAASSAPQLPNSGGRTVEFKDWWLDKSFGRIPIAKAAKSGENIVTLTAKPFTVWHELEAAFVLGDFALKPVDRGFVIAADAAPGILKRRDNPAHSINPDNTAWLSGGIGFHKNADGSPVEDRQPFVVFDLGKVTELTALRVWNYNESYVRDLTSRGAKAIRLRGTAAGKSDDFDLDLGEFTLARATANSPAQELPLNRPRVRFVKLEILSNHNGITFPASGTLADDGLVGLAEVEFVTPAGGKVSGVKIARVSGELVSHGRRAIHLVDGSGLVNARPGWNEQGHPFYAAGVSYRQQFRVDQPKGRFLVALPDWLGSVAEVKVNGKSAGYIVSAPWECDVTKQIKRGANDVEVIVIGTLKNTLGPHHGNPGLGSAWPGMFRAGPENGPPPGAQYSTVGYGLFEPFVLRQALAAKP
ncbi:MAG TPA: glycosyl hydrolase [Verrucomicrobiae bacterium]